MSTEHNCWQCGSTDAGSLFCRYCNSLQAPTPDYFEFLGLKRHLAMDAGQLQKQFYTLSRLLHPDHYTLRGEQEKRYSLEASSILNDAYRVLRDPIQRAEYVLKEAGYELAKNRNQDVPPELLEEVFELNMALDELRHGDVEVLPQLDESRRGFLARLRDIDARLGALFLLHDQGADDAVRRAVLEQIRAVLHRRRYISNLVEEVDKLLSARNA